MSGSMQIRLEDIRVVKLDNALDISDFDCGDADINGFLKDDALHHQDEMITSTILFLYNDKILGFCSLAADAIKLSQEEKIECIINKGDMKHYPQYPAVKLARFGRDRRYAKQGIGKNIIIPWVIGYLKGFERVAVRFITVDAYQKRIGYYEELGFVRNEHVDYARMREGMPLSMRFDLRVSTG